MPRGTSVYEPVSFIGPTNTDRSGRRTNAKPGDFDVVSQSMLDLASKMGA